MTARFPAPVRRMIAIGAMLAVTVVMAGCGSSEPAVDANGQEVVHWKHGIVHPGAEAGFLQMAREKDMFAKYGVDVEYVEFASAAQFFPALLAGEVDSIEGSPGALFSVAQKGQDVRVVGSTMPGLPWAIYARKGITSMEQLEGKSLAISAEGALPDQVAEAMLDASGVDTASIQYVNAGGNPDRYRAVVAGTVDAASAPADYVPMAEKDGLEVLALSSDIVPQFPRLTVIARGQSLDEKPAGMVGFLAGMAEGIRYAIEHPDEANEVAAKYLETSPDDPSITYITDLSIERDYLAPDVRIPTEELDFLQDLMIKQGVLDSRVDMDTFIDPSFREKALELVDQETGGD